MSAEQGRRRVNRTAVWNMSRQPPGCHSKLANRNLGEPTSKIQCDLARLQPLVELLSKHQSISTDISAKDMRWAIRRAESALDRRLIPYDMARLGSKIIAPVLLLASTRAKAAFNWSNQRRWFVANELLKRLSEEVWSDTCTTSAQSAALSGNGTKVTDQELTK